MIIVHIVQLFVNIYIIFLALDHDALTQIKATTPFELCFDLTYFSAMTFLGGDGLLSPATRWAQLVVLAESYIFAIYISMIIFGILTSDQSASSVDQTENKD